MAVIDDFFGKNTVKTNKAKRKLPAKTSTLNTTTTSITSETPIKRQKLDSQSSTLLSAEDVLKTIPDADPALLELSPDTEKMNFFQLKAKQNANSTASTHNDIDSIPKGRENCLNGLTIVFTGVLPSLDREQCEQLASKYGAKITKSISGKTSLVVIGNDAGPSKVKKIKSLKIKCIDQDGFISLISKMPSDGGTGEIAVKELAKKKELEKKVEEEIELEIKREMEAEDKEKEKINNNNNKILKNNSTPIIEKKKIDRDTQLWTDKYAPTDIKHICGNKSNVEMLNNWLATWFDKKHDLNGSTIDHYKAVLISGPPGIGKTTAATLLSKKLGYEVIEKNASDFRSKKILNDNLKVCLDNTSVTGFFDQNVNNNEFNKKRFLLLMDEVDGMSSGDNGGVAQLAQFCKTTKTPMILICNDKSLPKMRTLDKYCFDLVWRRPTSREIKSRLMSIAHREGLKLDPNLIDQLVSITHNDIRQIINIMSTISRTQKSLNFDNINSIQSSWEKEVSLKPFDVVGKLLSSNRLSINDKISLYFNDMDIIPLMIHENYKLTRPINAGNSKLEHLKQLSKSSDLISQSDLVNQQIRSGEQQWSLLPFHAILSTIYPSFEIQGQIINRINFTSWLGQNSKKMKFDRIVQNLQYHTCIKTKTNNIDLRLDYLPFLKEKLIKPLSENGSDGIETVLKIMDEYYLTKEDFDNILELSVHGNMKYEDIYKKIPTSVKSGFTRKYNSYIHPMVIYKTGDSVGKVSTSGDNDKDDDNENGDDENDIKKDSLIKEVKPKANISKPKSKAGKAGKTKK